ncbi:MAG: helix-turn-helix domain-containing protein [Deltaproteobacteria bacterium]|nr:helix-turn-helix domain-containing protein [Deltaproteobacteria bacterium]
MTGKRATIKKINFNEVGIGPIGFDHSRIEDVLEKRRLVMIEPHRHDYYEILWFTNCSGVHFVDFAAYDFTPNTLFFIAKNQIHMFEENDFKGHLLRFDEHFIHRCPESCVGFLEYLVYSSRTCPLRVIPPMELSYFNAIMDMLIEESLDPSKDHCEEMVATLLKALLLRSERLGPDTVATTVAKRFGRKIFFKFVACIEENYRRHLKVKDYAETLNIGTKRLTEICNLVSGSSAKKIIQERVILEAKRYLYHSELSIKEICYLLGFEDPAHFSKYFHKATSMYPLAFRKSMSEIYK